MERYNQVSAKSHQRETAKGESQKKERQKKGVSEEKTKKEQAQEMIAKAAGVEISGNDVVQKFAPCYGGRAIRKPIIKN